MPVDVELLRDAAARRWMHFMLRGDFESAWRESSFIDSTGYQDPHKLWNGECWSGKRVMIRCLHGLGDAIQFIRYAPLLRQTCRLLTVQTHPRLVTLLQMVDGVDKAVTWNEGEGNWDVQMEIMELPRAFGTSLSTIPADVPYIRLTSEQRRWAAALVPKTARLNVGLVWQASAWNPNRSIPLNVLAPILELDGFRFYGLQKEMTESIPGLRDIEKHATAISDTAALMSQMDLIISVDTMTAHLAGALGKPVWILLPVDADWRWMLDRHDSPWYPTAALFRQSRPGDWSATIDEVTESLVSLSASHVQRKCEEKVIPQLASALRMTAMK
ncbi:MAG TPA: hypothetical protein VFA65_21040 [Bryobacteraceae bacterium]|nr:hypothetical protein [Bryobacteraceae bacterium]